MGCDIHLYVEGKLDGKWHPTKGESYYYKKYGMGEELVYEDWLYPHRNYTLFAILANVRNDYGCAGCDIGDPLNYIDEPRGLPLDVSPFIAQEYAIWDGGAHSASYFTLQELLDFDWTQIATRRGYVTENGFTQYKREGQPSYWCGGFSGATLKDIPNSEMEAIISGVKEREPGIKYYTQIEWKEPYMDAVDIFYDNIMKLKEIVDPENTRIVFWFDN